jgi:hypothetical protein
VREESGSGTVIVGLAALARDNGEDKATPLEDGLGDVVPFVSEKMRVKAVPGVTIDIVKSAAAGVGDAVAMGDEVEDCESVNGSTEDCLTTYDDVCEIAFWGGGAYWRRARGILNRDADVSVVWVDIFDCKLAVPARVVVLGGWETWGYIE